MHPNKELASLLVDVVSQLREHFDVVSISCSVHEDEDGQTYQYVNHRGHIRAVIGDMQEHLDMLRDMDGGGPPAYEPEYIEGEEND